MQFRVLLLASLAALGLAACGHMPVSTMVALRSFDFSTFDPTALRAAVQLPEALFLKADGVSLKVTVKFGDEAPEVDTFVLRQVVSPDETAPLARFAKSGEVVFAYALTERDVAAVRALQEQGRRVRAEHPGKNSIAIAVEPHACRRGVLPPGPVLSTTYLRPDAATGYVTFLRDVDLREAMKRGGLDFEAATPACDDASSSLRP